MLDYQLVTTAVALMESERVGVGERSNQCVDFVGIVILVALVLAQAFNFVNGVRQSRYRLYPQPLVNDQRVFTPQFIKVHQRFVAGWV